MFRKCLLSIAILCLSGCAAVLMRLDDHPCPYLGVRVDWALLEVSQWRLLPFVLFDAPFSAVVDTLFYPFEYEYSCNL